MGQQLTLDEVGVAPDEAATEIYHLRRQLQCVRSKLCEFEPPGARGRSSFWTVAKVRQVVDDLWSIVGGRGAF